MTPKTTSKSKRVAVRVPPDEHKAFKKLCADLEVSIESRLLTHIKRDLKKSDSHAVAVNN